MLTQAGFHVLPEGASCANFNIKPPGLLNCFSKSQSGFQNDRVFIFWFLVL